MGTKYQFIAFVNCNVDTSERSTSNRECTRCSVKFNVSCSSSSTCAQTFKGNLCASYTMVVDYVIFDSVTFNIVAFRSVNSLTVSVSCSKGSVNVIPRGYAIVCIECQGVTRDISIATFEAVNGKCCVFSGLSAKSVFAYRDSLLQSVNFDSFFALFSIKDNIAFKGDFINRSTIDDCAIRQFVAANRCAGALIGVAVIVRAEGNFVFFAGNSS